jgi:hypothetical protein
MLQGVQHSPGEAIYADFFVHLVYLPPNARITCPSKWLPLKNIAATRSIRSRNLLMIPSKVEMQLKQRVTTTRICYHMGVKLRSCICMYVRDRGMGETVKLRWTGSLLLERKSQLWPVRSTARQSKAETEVWMATKIPGCHAASRAVGGGGLAPAARCPPLL